jgi:uncharacterized membrane protein YfcA
MKEPLFYMLFGFLLGFYDGFLGPGTGSFWVIALVFFLGYNLSKATAYTKVFNLKSNLIATACFAFGHNIDYKIALMMAAGQFFGGKIGSQLVILKGSKLVRPIFLVIVFFTLITMFYKSYLGYERMTKIYNFLGLQGVLLFFIFSCAATYFYFYNKKQQSE